MRLNRELTMTTKPKKYTMLDMMNTPSGPAEYHLIQGGHLAYAGTDWRRVGAMMAWLRQYRCGEVNFFKNGVLTETLPEPKYEEPPPPSEEEEIQVTAAMVRAANEVLHSDQSHPYLRVIKHALQAALRAYYDEKANKGH